MVLVDTSVLIDYLRSAENAAVRRFQQVLDANLAFGISPLTYLEVLQGTRTGKDYATIKSYLETHRFYGLLDEKDSTAAAAHLLRLPEEGHHGQQYRRLPDRPDRDRERPGPAAQRRGLRPHAAGRSPQDIRMTVPAPLRADPVVQAGLITLETAELHAAVAFK